MRVLTSNYHIANDTWPDAHYRIAVRASPDVHCVIALCRRIGFVMELLVTGKISEGRVTRSRTRSFVGYPSHKTDTCQQRFCLDSEDISSALQYSSERVSLVAILLSLRISQEQCVRKETKDNGGFETEHQGRSGSNFSHHATTSDTELPETLAGTC